MHKWISLNQAAELLGYSPRTLREKCRANHFGRYQRRTRGRGGKGGAKYQISTGHPKLSPALQAQHQTPIHYNVTASADIYSRAPDWARRTADKYLQIISLAGNARGAELQRIVDRWNDEHPDNQTSYRSVIRARKTWRTRGAAGLLAQYGNRVGESTVRDEWLAYFKSLYLKEGSPSATVCWKTVLGWALEQDSNLDLQAFPSHEAFLRRLKQEVLPESIYRSRNGAKRANRKFGFYIKRDYSDVHAGEVWVSDHCQIDIAASYHDGARTRYCFPWCTVWRDFKSGKWLGWRIAASGPSTDAINEAFYTAANRYGLPNCAYLDNGKDYRSRDFSGGRRKVRVSVDEPLVRSLTSALGIEVVFAWPYNAQAKPVERDFLANKEALSKQAPGYRGGNVVERPESLNGEIAAGHILSIEDLCNIFDTFVREVLNQNVVNHGHRAGHCPDEIWENESPAAVSRGALRRVSSDALRLFCARTSNDMTIGRRGVRDSKLGVDYYDEWMIAHKGRRVYLRREPSRFDEAWVFDAQTNEYIGQGRLVADAPALARTQVEHRQLRDAINVRRRAEKVARSYMETAAGNTVPLADKVRHMATATRAANEARGYTPSEPLVIPQQQITEMDRAIARRNRDAREGEQDISGLASLDRPKKRKLYTLESELDEDRDRALQANA